MRHGAVEKAAERLAELVRTLEIVLAALVLVGVLAAAGFSVHGLFGLDWTQSATFDLLMARVLYVAIGLELVRMLVVHSLQAILEMLAFAIARSMLGPTVRAHEIALGSAGFVALLAANRYFLQKKERPVTSVTPAGPPTDGPAPRVPESAGS